MYAALRHRSFRRLFTAHIVALLGTGLSTIAIGLLAVGIAGDSAAGLIGTLLSLKMLTFLLIGPLAPAIARRVGVKRLLIATDITRALIALALPFIDSAAMAIGLVVLLQSSAALFTPTFQATIPRVVPDRKEYTGALALSRLAYDLEALLSPALAGLILVLASSSSLFFGTSIGFLASAALILSAVIPKTVDDGAPVRNELTLGARRMFSTPALRATLILDLALAFIGAVPMALTIPLVMNGLGGDATASTALLGAFGVGSIISAILMPTIIAKLGPRRYMLTGLLTIALSMTMVWPVMTFTPPEQTLTWLFVIWFVAGGGNSAVVAPMGRVVRDNTSDRDLPHVFAARFSIAHGWWLITYPLAGWGATAIGYGPMVLTLAITSLIALAFSAWFWKRQGDAPAVPPPASSTDEDHGPTPVDAAEEGPETGDDPIDAGIGAVHPRGERVRAAE